MPEDLTLNPQKSHKSRHGNTRLDLRAQMVGGKAEMESLEAWGSAGLAYTSSTQKTDSH